MSIKIYIKQAYANLVSSKLRSFLAVLGVLIGTAAIVALISIGELGTEHAINEFKVLGTNILSMDLKHKPRKQLPDTHDQVQFSKMQEIKQTSSLIKIVSPYTLSFSTVYLMGKSVDTAIIGSTDELLDMLKMKLERGRFISYLDKYSFFCVIGSNISDFFLEHGVSNPIGHQILIGDFVFTVVGVIKPWEPSWFLYADVNDSIVIPLEASYLLGRNISIRNILFRLAENSDIDKIQKKLVHKMENLYPQFKADFRNPNQIINIMRKQQQTFSWLLAAISSISLFVGGIGVMNIMYVSVIERRREIGIRMAVGARRRHIRQMFLIESTILSLIGGSLGVVLGVGMAITVALLSGWKVQILFFPPLLGLSVSVFIGILSGFYPAYCASKLDPIETLRGSD